MPTTEDLRKKYPRFFYTSYSWEQQKKDLHISFVFRVPPEIVFHPRIVIKGVLKDGVEKIEEGIINNLVFHLGLVEMVSYWKATASPEIVVEAGFLNTEQIAWWEDLLVCGMGEFFYRNHIDFTKQNFLIIQSSFYQSHGNGKKITRFSGKLSNQTLIPVGGGKDAIVTLERLKKMRHRAFVLNPKQEHNAIFKIAGEKNPIVVERAIDPTLLELNRKGYLNGHTPFSAYLAFLSVLCAVFFDYKYIAFSNERSSNEGNVEYLGRMINHQYSKSFEFEKNFREYSKKYLAKDIEYFSFLRPLYELQIAKIFARYPKYFGAFLSCNEANKTKSGTKKPSGKWCGKCAKCLFVFLVLYPFAKERTLGIFGKNLAKDKKLKPLLQELTGKKRLKPFECVGTVAESRAALSLSQRKLKTHPLLRSWNAKHFLPPRFESILKNSH
ncbi:MAG: putative UDP-N-acetylmuramoylalanine--D-glutamate ligase [Parcubacteria group bacterium Greene0714_21]|nr:MAG: putative UDP-N-acetylmuramoylalanine--D-glutamate ligase [Parcubacteria group bacterium Greene0416_39]TSC97783.1 MAG: putative UDP-N-acetylmuramoylalanine--D-glutamate ligase [Parcubacteria group bacterium Greene1014_47]TSD04257.1 MAG: putative UDP-N-acetylmuramoylalanine--D-glutamate ligase [Parcubacteria group bacterium Greene0714_21]